MLIDCFGKSYSLIKMASTGFCGFHALSYCLTGSQWRHADIIYDCLNVFTNVPELFRIRTNFGSRRDSSVSIRDYEVFMRNAIMQVQSGVSVDNDAWCEDGHLAAISLLYDICLCAYSEQGRQWNVFNESGRRGYMCLLSSPGHFDVLSGSDGAPAIPIEAHSNGVRRYGLSMSNDAWQCLQHQYTFQCVHKFPEQFGGIRILNSPLAVFNAEVASATRDSDCDLPEVQESAHRCNFVGCSYVTGNIKGLEMHKLRVHNSTAQKLRVQKVHFCDVSGCSYSNVQKQRVLLHKRRKHSKLATDSYNENVADVHHAESVENLETFPIDVEMVSKCGSADYDVNSVASTETTCSRRSQRIAGKNKAIFLQAVDEQPVSKKGRYVCEVEGCGSVHETARGLSIHKGRRHSSKGKVVDGTRSVESESFEFSNSSMTKKSGVGEASVPRAETVQVPAKSNKVRFVCDIDGCGSVHDTARGLSMHKTKRHSSKVVVQCAQAEDARSMEYETASMSTVDSTTSSVRRSVRISNQKKVSQQSATYQRERTAECTDSSNSWHQRVAKNTRKDNLQTSFSEQISYLEKSFMPRGKVTQQTDPLYDNLKQYHDR